MHAPRAIDDEVDVGRIGGHAEERISAEPFGIGGRWSRVVRAPRLPRMCDGDTAVATSAEVLEHGRMAVSRASTETRAREYEEAVESGGQQRRSLEASTPLTLSALDPALVRAGRERARPRHLRLVRGFQGWRARGRAPVKPPLALVSRGLNRGVACEERIGSDEAPD